MGMLWWLDFGNQNLLYNQRIYALLSTDQPISKFDQLLHIALYHLENAKQKQKIPQVSLILLSFCCVFCPVSCGSVRVRHTL
jgi:hypothetical protein